uniref:O-fucosyltransferase family protein n=1 Tax=Kalanchoe fedtschenkoi TaxID=63787 RepID=A0A7N0REI3_KALFE
MESSNFKRMRFGGCYLNSIACKCLALFGFALVLRSVSLPTFSVYDYYGIYTPKTNTSAARSQGSSLPGNVKFGIRVDKFLEVPQIVWGLNNQKIAFARACLTAKMLNRTLLMPSLSASLFYKEVDLLQPIYFDKVFKFDHFNSHCQGSVRLGRYSEISNNTDSSVELPKGSGRRWTVERDMEQLRQYSTDPFDSYEVIKITGKNPFLWPDHWPVEDYAKIFDSLVLVDDIAKDVEKVVSKIRERGGKVRGDTDTGSSGFPYMAVHMRIEKDWMIHCKKLEQRQNISEICSSKDEIMERVHNVRDLQTPMVIYLAVADTLLEDNFIFDGWKEGFHPVEKHRLGVYDIYERYPYLIQSAIDYEVCLKADVFVGNSFSTFSSLIALQRTQKMINMGVKRSCGIKVRWPSYAYNILGESNGPQLWMTNMSDSSLQAISYGTNKMCLINIPGAATVDLDA